MARREPIKYRDVLAMPGSQLHTLLEEAAKATGKDKDEANKKVQLSYGATDVRYRQLTEKK